MSGSDELAHLPKELSWLSFNHRVLQEAQDPTVPLIERVRFLGIFSNNMDEFYRVRVADVRRLAAFSRTKDKETYRQLLERIRARVMELKQSFESVYQKIISELAEHNIYLINEAQLLPHQADFVRRYFVEKVLPELAPFTFPEGAETPELDDASIYLSVKLLLGDGSTQYALVKVPTDSLPRFIEIPAPEGTRRKVVIVLDNIMRAHLKDIFRGILSIVDAEAYTIKMTRDAELELGEGITQSLMDKMSQSLKKRKKGDPVRFVYDQAMPVEQLDFLVKKLGLGSYDNLIAGGRYHNSKDFMKFPNLGSAKLEYKAQPVLASAQFDRHANVFDAIRAKDILLYYPYHSFRYVENLLQTAAIDPSVRSVMIVLYRVADKSHVANALINAARNGKAVTAVVELQARFDEESNIKWAKRLTEAGARVIFGVPGLKVHAKLILIERVENKKPAYYAHVGTGNFNEKTARFYTDLSLFTADREIAREAAKVFEFISYNYKRFNYKSLAVSPYSNRSTLTRLVQKEIHNAEAGLSSGITIKCNNLVDTELVELLYEASQAGVRVRIIVRGMCSLRPGVPGLSDNIEAISIVDRYLEHPRIYVFHNEGHPLYYLSSADLMTRNLDFRVEVTCPINDPDAQAMIQSIIDLQWADNVKARIISGDQVNDYRPTAGKAALRCQPRIYRMLADRERLLRES